MSTHPRAAPRLLLAALLAAVPVALVPSAEADPVCVSLTSCTADEVAVCVDSCDAGLVSVSATGDAVGCTVVVAPQGAASNWDGRTHCGTVTVGYHGANAYGGVSVTVLGSASGSQVVGVNPSGGAEGGSAVIVWGHAEGDGFVVALVGSATCADYGTCVAYGFHDANCEATLDNPLSFCVAVTPAWLDEADCADPLVALPWACASVRLLA